MMRVVGLYPADDCRRENGLIEVPCGTPLRCYRWVATIVLDPLRSVPVVQFFGTVRRPVEIEHFAWAVRIDIIWFWWYRKWNTYVFLSFWRQTGQLTDETPVVHISADEDHIDYIDSEKADQEHSTEDNPLEPSHVSSILVQIIVLHAQQWLWRQTKGSFQRRLIKGTN